jgi:myo-inositol-1(or 4)-monophosphatase
MTEVQKLSEFAQLLAAESGQVILPLFRNIRHVDNKLDAGWDPVTEADKAAERVIRQLIESRFPDHGIIGEEYGVKPSKSGYEWVLDPIDGTRAFVVGMPTWATLIALYFEGAPLLSVVNQPFTGEMFVGLPDHAFLSVRGANTPLKVRQTDILAQAQIGTTSPHLYLEPSEAARFDNLQKKVQLMRYGGDAYFFCMVAAGHLDVAMDPRMQIYDIAALIPVIKGAGGHVAEWTGANPAHGGNVVTAGSQQLLEQVVALMNS